MVERPAPETCTWPLDHPEYRAWLERRNIDEHRGLLRLTGHPGSGKSVLVKALAAACATNAKCPENQVATFFFDANGTFDQKIRMGLLKGLLFQLLPFCTGTFKHFKSVHNLKLIQDGKADGIEWHFDELKEILSRFAKTKRDEPVYIFVDAIDECQNTEARDVAMLLQDLTTTAYNASSNLNICMSCRRHPTVSIRYCAKISVDGQNYGDVERYVDRELDQYEMEPSTRNVFGAILASKAGGVFLWVRLVLDSISRSFDAGLSLDLVSLLGYLEELPRTLHKLFDQILDKLSPREKLQALRLFQWAILAQRPLSASEWVHVLAFVDEPELRSIHQWTTSRYGIHNMGQLARRLRSMTGGLLEVTFHHASEDSFDEQAQSGDLRSFRSKGSAVAGSMELFDRDNAMVEFTHLSAYQYFLTGDGFEQLGQVAPPTCFGAGHICIAATCLRYPCLDEISPLFFGGEHSIAAGSEHATLSNKQMTSHHNSSGTNLSVVSLGSSAASSSRRYGLQFPELPARPEKAAAPSEKISESRSWFLREWLDTMSKPSDSVVPISSQSGEHTGSSFDYDTQEQLMHSGRVRPPPVSNVSENLTKSEAYVRLSEDPVLRLYAIEMFIHHAVEADALGADPSWLLDAVERDRDSCVGSGYWYKWCQLKDDVRSDTTPVYFAVTQNLETWIRWYATYSSLETMLVVRGGRLRYPLLAAMFWNNESMLTLLSPHVNSDVSIKDVWTLLNHLAAISIGAHVLISNRRRAYLVVTLLLDLNRLATAPAHRHDGPLLPRFRNYMRSSGLRGSVLRKLLLRIEVSYKTALLLTNVFLPELFERDLVAESFLDNCFTKAGN